MTDPTPERRWTLEGPLTWFYLDGQPQFAADILDALNEAEDLRAERDQWRSRYIVMARLNHRARHIENGPLAMEDCYYAECAEVRALAGAETEALYDDEHAASCDVNTSPHDYGWEKVTTCTCGTDGGERRGG